MVRVFPRKGELFFPKKCEMQGLYISCQFVETAHRRLICIRRIKSRSSSTRKKKQKKRLPTFLHMFSKFQHLEDLMTFGDN